MRKHYLDNIRTITVLLVIFYHVIYMFNSVLFAGVVGPFHDVQYQDVIQYILYPWFMVLLFIVSGMSARFALDRQSPREFLRSRTVKLLVPSTIGLFVWQWIQGYINMRLGGVFETMHLSPLILYPILAISGTGVLWYIQMLWLFSVLLLLVRRFETGRLYAACGKVTVPVLVLLGVAVWGSSQILNTPVVVVYRFGIYGFCFLLGYFVFSHDTVMDRLAGWGVAFAFPALILAVVYSVVYWGQDYASVPVVNSPLSVAYLWCVCLAILGCMKRWGDRTSPFMQFLNKKSFGMYVLHYLPLSATAMLLCEHTHLPPLCVYLLTAIAAYGGALVLYEILSRIPVLRWCVLGISSPKKEA